MVSTLLSFFANSNFCIFHSALMNNIVTVQRHRQSQNLKMCLTEQPTKRGLEMLTHLKMCIPGHNRQITDADYIYIVTVLSFLCPHIFPYCNNENPCLDNATSYGNCNFDFAIRNHFGDDLFCISSDHPKRQRAIRVYLLQLKLVIVKITKCEKFEMYLQPFLATMKALILTSVLAALTSANTCTDCTALVSFVVLFLALFG